MLFRNFGISFLAPSLLTLACTHASAGDSLVFALINMPGLMEISDGQTSAKGDFVDKVRELGTNTGIQFNFEMYPPARGVALVNAQKDFCVPMAKTDENANLKWAGPIARFKWAIYASGSDLPPLPNVESLRGKTIGVLRNTPISSFFIGKGLKVEFANDSVSNLRKLMAKRIDYWADPDIDASRVISVAGNPPVQRVLDVLEVEGYIACNPSVSDQTITKLNEAISRMRLEGKWKNFGL